MPPFSLLQTKDSFNNPAGLEWTGKDLSLLKSFPPYDWYKLIGFKVNSVLFPQVNQGYQN